MKKLFEDAWKDLSSGALMRLSAAVAVVAILALGFALSRQIDDVLTLVAVFSAVVVAAQSALSIQGASYAPGQGVPVQVGFLRGPSDNFDTGRLIKLVFFYAAMTLAIVVVCVWPGRIIDAAKVCGVLVGISVSTDIVQKASGT